MTNEKVPNPVRWFRPTKMREPTPATRRPGASTISMVCPPNPMISISKKAPTRGEPSSVAMAAKLPAAPMTTAAIGGAVLLDQVDGQDAEPAPDGDQGRLGSEHHTEAERGKGRRNDSEQVHGRHGPAGLEALRGLVPSGSGQVADGQSHQKPAQGEPGQRPPQWLSVESQLSGKVAEDLLLDLGDRLQEEVGNGRERDADDTAEDEERQIALGPKELCGVERTRTRRRRCGVCRHVSGASVDQRAACRALRGCLIRPLSS